LSLGFWGGLCLFQLFFMDDE